MSARRNRVEIDLDLNEPTIESPFQNFEKRRKRSERRQARSAHQLLALQLQLEHVARRIGMDAVVLCDDFGAAIASYGDEELVVALAEQSPWLAHRPPADRDDAIAFLWDVYPSLTDDMLAVRTIPLGLTQEHLVLCAISRSNVLEAWAEHTAVGVHRILHTAIH